MVEKIRSFLVIREEAHGSVGCTIRVEKSVEEAVELCQNELVRIDR